MNPKSSSGRSRELLGLGALSPGEAGQRLQEALDLGAICFVWASCMLIFGALQVLGFPNGFSVRPIGEDWIWLAHVQKGSGSSVAQEFWRVDGRNPLIPWWYVLFRPLLLGFENALLLLRHASRLILAAGVYLSLVDAVGQRVRPVALGVGLLIVVFGASGYRDNLMWAVISVTALAVLAIWCFSRATKAASTAAHWLAASLVLWLVVLGSYTLQAGALVAIALISVYRSWRYSQTIPQFTSRVLADLWTFIAISLLFFLIWRSTASGFMSNSLSSISVSVPALFRSASLGFWHIDYPEFIGLFESSLSQAARWTLFGIVFAVVFGALTYRGRAHGMAPDWRSLVVLALGALCLAVPTVLVETVASQVWFPGSRWRMLHPFWVPAMLVVAAGAIATLPWMPGWQRILIFNVLTSVAAGALFLASVGHNEVQVRISRYERALQHGLTKIVASESRTGSVQPINFLIRNESPYVMPVFVGPSQAKIWFAGRDITMRPLLDPGMVASHLPVRFGPDGEGVENARLVTSDAGLRGLSAPYSTIRVVVFDGREVRLLSRPEAVEFAALPVKWERSGPLPSP